VRFYCFAASDKINSVYRVIAFACLTIATPVLSAKADTQPSSDGRDARAHFLAGEAAYREERWADALVEFRAGHMLNPRPEFLLNMAQTHRRLGQYKEASEKYEQYLKEASDSRMMEKVRAMLARLPKERAAFEEGTRGAQLLAKGQPAQALEAYQRAYLLNIEEPRYLRSMADCYRSLRNDADALRFYKLYLDERPKSADRLAVVEAMHAIERGEPPPEAKEQAAAPAVQPEAKPEPNPEPKAEAPSLVSEEPAKVERSNPLQAPAPDRPRPVYKRWWFWTVLGVGVAAVAAGTAVAVIELRGPSFKPTLPPFGSTHAVLGSDPAWNR
jgi:tetratricopeptide (TPR) repeat protein